jgi:hypothetical protein
MWISFAVSLRHPVTALARAAGVRIASVTATIMSDDDAHLYQSIAHHERELRTPLASVDRCMRDHGQRGMLDGEVGRAAGIAAELQLALTRLGYGEDEEATRAAARSMIHHAFDLAARYRKGLL